MIGNVKVANLEILLIYHKKDTMNMVISSRSIHEIVNTRKPVFRYSQ